MHPVFFGRLGEGVFFHRYHSTSGTLQPFVDVHSVEGTVRRYADMGAISGLRYFRIETATDPSDNQTVFAYDSQGRLTRIKHPSGIDEVWNYAPSWIGSGAGKWDAQTYSGVEIYYEDSASTPADLSAYTQYLLFRKVPNGRPFAGDLLFRVYQARFAMLDDLPETAPNELYTLPPGLAAPERFAVTELGYWAGTSRLQRLSYLAVDGIAAGSQESEAIITREFEYVEAPSGSGRFRVSKETFPLTARESTFTYAIDPNEPSRVDTVTRVEWVGTQVVATVQRTFDDFQRMTQEVITPSNDVLGRPRAFDPDASGDVEPAVVTRNYAYSACGSCGGKPTVIDELPSGRHYEYDYDTLTGLLTEARVPSPSGSGVATTQWQWAPAVAGNLYSAYKLTGTTNAAGVHSTITHVSVPRVDPSHGVKHQVVVLTSPPVAQPGGALGVAVTVASEYDVSAPAVSNGRQTAFVGQILSHVNGDGVFTAFEYDASGLLSKTIENPNGGDARVETALTHDRFGRLVQIVMNAQSSLPQTVTLTYDSCNQLTGSSAVVNGHAIEEKLFRDRWGNLAVHLQKNANGAGGAPADFGTPGRTEIARPWIRNEWQYVGDRLARAYSDRRPLDRDGDTEAIADTQQARYLRTDYLWHPMGWPLTVALPNGAAKEFTHDGYGTLYKCSITSPGASAIVSRWFVNSSLEVVRQIEGVGAGKLVTTLTRNGSGQVESVTEPQVVSPGAWYPWAPAYAVHEFDSDALGKVVEARVLDGATASVIARTHTSYDQLSRPYVVDLYEPPGSATPTRTYSVLWEGASKRKKVTGPGGRSVESLFDGLGRVTESSDSLPGSPNKLRYEYLAKAVFLGKVTARTWDGHPGVEQYVDRVTEYTRDGLGRVVHLLQGPAGNELEHAFTYYATGETESYTDPSGKVHRYLPDGLGRLCEHYLPGAQPVWNGTDYVDWTGTDDRSEVRQTDGRGRITRSIVDFAGRLQAELDPGSSTEPTLGSPHQPFSRFFAYDTASRLIGVYQGDGVVDNLYRDGAGRLIARSTPSAAANQYVSVYHGRDLLQRNALGQVLYTASYYGPDGAWGLYHQESFAHDSLGRLLRESHKFLYGGNWVDIENGFSGGDSLRSSVNYDNNLTGDADDLWVDRTPDVVGRLAQVDWRTTSGGTPSVLAKYWHEGSAIRRRATHFAATQSFNTDYRYDAYGRMDKIDQSFSASSTVDFHYDLASNLVKEEYQKQGGVNQKGDRFTYDEHHRLASAWLGADQAELDDPGNGTFIKKLTYGLDASNSRTGVTTQLGPQGVPATSTYSTQDQGEPQGASNRYDEAEGVAPIYDQRGNTIFDGNLFYVYDELNRLSEIYMLSGSQQLTSSASTSTASSTRAVSARRQEQVARGRFVVEDLSVLRAARSRILSRFPVSEILQRHRETGFVALLRESLPSSVHRQVSSSSSTLSTSSASTSEDATMEPVAVYLYDPWNRRVARLVMGVQNWFTAWDGWSEAEELVLGYDGQALVTKPERQFVWGEQLDELVAYRYRQPGQATFASFFIAEGGAHCPSRVLDSTGEVVEVQEYDPHGKASIFDGSGTSVGGWSQDAVGNPFQWKGHRVDPETGLTYMRNRYYKSTWGRFTSPDLLGPWGDEGGLGNAYVYTSANPLNRSDRGGLQMDGRETHLLYDMWETMLSIVLPEVPKKPELQMRAIVQPVARVLEPIANRAGGLLQACGGASEAVAGGAITVGSEGMVGWLGVPMVAHGTDHFLAGMEALITGRSTSTLTSQSLEAMGMSPGAAGWTDAGIGVGLSGGAALSRFALRVGGEVVGTVGNAGGRLGDAVTRAHVYEVGSELESRGWEVVGGGGRFPEEYLPGLGGGRKGSSFVDITATRDGRTLRINTIDTLKDGVTPTAREARNAARIRTQTPGEHLLLVPKPK